MLKTLSIRNLAIIDTLEIELFPGLNVFTGETGAGKSIVVEALGLTLGDRADAALVRSGADRTEVSAVFDISANNELRELLEERGLDAGDECILRRVLLADGGSRAYCNGTPVTVQSLREYAQLLVDIHSQNAHQSLLRRDVQRALLDEFGALTDEAAAVNAAWRSWHQADQALRELTAGSENRDAEIDLVRYQYEELNDSVPDAAGMDALETAHKRLANASRIIEACDGVATGLDDDEAGLLRQLARCQSQLQATARYAPELAEVIGLLENADTQLQEAVHTLRRFAENLDSDPAEFDRVERKLEQLHELARKHRVDMHALPERLAALKERLDLYARQAGDFDALTARREASLNTYRERAKELARKRKTAAKRMGQQITEHMRTLGMPGGRFEVSITTDAGAPPTAHGADNVEFTVSANPGQDLRPLAKVASGGELSRISLSIQVATAGRGGVPVLVYDEVDAGIGGAVAEIVGRRLAALGKTAQVLCITHLPQVACCGHHHFVVGKEVEGNATRTAVTLLPRDERVVEIARMLGGIDITAKTLEHARELLSLAD